MYFFGGTTPDEKNLAARFAVDFHTDNPRWPRDKVGVVACGEYACDHVLDLRQSYAQEILSLFAAQVTKLKMAFDADSSIPRRKKDLPPEAYDHWIFDVFYNIFPDLRTIITSLTPGTGEFEGKTMQVIVSIHPVTCENFRIL